MHLFAGFFQRIFAGGADSRRALCLASIFLAPMFSAVAAGRVYDHVAGFHEVEIIGVSSNGFKISHQGGVSFLEEAKLAPEDRVILKSELQKMKRLQEKQKLRVAEDDANLPRPWRKLDVLRQIHRKRRCRF